MVFGLILGFEFVVLMFVVGFAGNFGINAGF